MLEVPYLWFQQQVADLEIKMRVTQIHLCELAVDHLIPTNEDDTLFGEIIGWL